MKRFILLVLFLLVGAAGRGSAQLFLKEGVKIQFHDGSTIFSEGSSGIAYSFNVKAYYNGNDTANVDSFVTLEASVLLFQPEDAVQLTVLGNGMEVAGRLVKTSCVSGVCNHTLGLVYGAEVASMFYDYNGHLVLSVSFDSDRLHSVLGTAYGRNLPNAVLNVSVCPPDEWWIKPYQRVGELEAQMKDPVLSSFPFTFAGWAYGGYFQEIFSVDGGVTIGQDNGEDGLTLSHGQWGDVITEHLNDTQLHLDDFNHVACTYDNVTNQRYLYLNGKVVNSDINGGFNFFIRNVFKLQKSDARSIFGELQVFRTVISHSDVIALMSNKLTDPLADFLLRLGPGKVPIDPMGNARVNGTLAIPNPSNWPRGCVSAVS